MMTMARIVGIVVWSRFLFCAILIQLLFEVAPLTALPSASAASSRLVREAAGEVEDALIFEADEFIQEVKTADQVESIFESLIRFASTNESPLDDLRSVQLNRTDSNFRLASDDKVVLILYYSSWCPNCHRFAITWRRLAKVFNCTRGIRFFAFECNIGTKDRFGDSRISPYEFCFDSQKLTAVPTVFAYIPERFHSGDDQIGVKETKEERKNHLKEFATAIGAAKTLSASSASPSASSSSSSSSSSILKMNGMDEFQYPIKGLQKTNATGILVRRAMPILKPTIANLTDWVTTRTPISTVQECVPQPALTSSTEPNASAVLERSPRWTSNELTPCPDVRLRDALDALLYLVRNLVIGDSKDEMLEGQKQSALLEFLAIVSALLPGHNVQSALIAFYEELHRRQSVTGAEYQRLVDSLELAGLKASAIGTSSSFLHKNQFARALWLLFHTMTVSYYTETHRKETPFTSVSLDSDACASLGTQKPLAERFQNDSVDRSVLRSTHTVSAWGIARSIRSTVDNFFPCEICRLDFISSFDRCEDDLCSWVIPKRHNDPITDGQWDHDSDPSIFNTTIAIDSIDTIAEETFNTTIAIGDSDTRHSLNDSAEGLLLWLWRFHNSVTFRTAVEKTSDAIVALQEIKASTLRTRNQTNLISFEGQDVRFPPLSSCPTCRFNLTKVLQAQQYRSSLNATESVLTPDAFTVSKWILERQIRGDNPIQTSITADDDEQMGLTEKTWDRIEDFNLDNVRKFLVGFYWRAEWSKNGLHSLDLTWDEKHTTFVMTVPATNSIEGTEIPPVDRRIHETIHDEEPAVDQAQSPLSERSPVAKLKPIVVEQTGNLYREAGLEVQSRTVTRGGSASGMISVLGFSSLLIVGVLCSRRRSPCGGRAYQFLSQKDFDNDHNGISSHSDSERIERKNSIAGSKEV